MPPRATAAAIVSSSAQSQQDSILETEGVDSYELPKAVVTRIAKSALPPSARFSHDTIIALNRGATVFINYLSAAAQDVAHSKSHKTIAASDVLKALELLELGDIMEVCQKELEIYRQEQKTGGGKGKAKAAAAEASASSSTTAAAATTTTEKTAPTPAPSTSAAAAAATAAVGRPTYDVVMGSVHDYQPGPSHPTTTLPPPPLQHQHTPMVNPYYSPTPYAAPPAPPRKGSTPTSTLQPYTVSSGPYRPTPIPTLTGAKGAAAEKEKEKK